MSRTVAIGQKIYIRKREKKATPANSRVRLTIRDVKHAVLFREIASFALVACIRGLLVSS